MDDDDLTNLDKAGLLAASSESVRARRRAEVRELKALLEWARAHSGEPVHPRDRLLELAGEGAPQVQEFWLGFLVNHRGTRSISAGEARLILDAHPASTSTPAESTAGSGGRRADQTTRR